MRGTGGQNQANNRWKSICTILCQPKNHSTFSNIQIRIVVNASLDQCVYTLSRSSYSNLDRPKQSKYSARKRYYRS